MKLTIFKKKTKNPSAIPSAQGHIMHQVGRDSFMDWAWMLSLAIIITSVLGVLGIYYYIDMGKRLDDASSLKHPVSLDIIDAKALGEIITRFNGHETERAALLKGYNGFSDPSI